MLLVAVTGVIVWLVFRKLGLRYGVLAFIVVSGAVTYLTVQDMRMTGVTRYDTGESPDEEFSIVHYNSQALFPFVIQKRHNWTARTFVHQVRFLNQNGTLVFETNTQADQSEYMHISLFMVTLRFCTYGMLLAGGVIILTEVIQTWRRR